MNDFYKLYSIGKNTKKPYSRGKSFGYQVLGFGSGVNSAIAHRAVWAGNFLADSSPSNIIDFVEIATLGNATDFGDQSVARHRLNSSSASSTRGIWFGGNTQPTRTNIIDYVTIATQGNATDFGDTSVLSQHGGSAGNDTRAVHNIGDQSDNSVNILEYVTIANTGNTTDFGDLTSSANDTSGASSNKIRGVMAKGGTPNRSANIDYITIATTGNAADFGDRTVEATYGGCCSNGNGGLA